MRFTDWKMMPEGYPCANNKISTDRKAWNNAIFPLFQASVAAAGEGAGSVPAAACEPVLTVVKSMFLRLAWLFLTCDGRSMHAGNGGLNELYRSRRLLVAGLV